MLEDYERYMEMCFRCSLCKWPPLAQVKSWRFSNICPSIQRYNFHAYSGGGRLIVAYAYLQGRIGLTKSLVDLVYRCSMCGACDVSCKHNSDIEVYETLHAFRVQLYEEGAVLPKHREIIENTLRHGNPYGEVKEKKAAWAKNLKVKDLNKEKADVLYFVGCTAALRRPEVAVNTVKILKAAGVDFGILGSEEPCCASTAYKIGARDVFEKHARRNVELVNKLNVETLVTSCAGCYRMFRVEYPTVAELGFEVLHTSQLLEKLIRDSSLKLTGKVPLKVTYHDPCHLGRLGEPRTPWSGVEKKVLGHLILTDPPKPVRRGGGGVYDPPRNVLKSIPGVELVEMERIREYAYCCNAGGGVKAAFPDFALWGARERVEEAKSTGAQAIVTCCPFCEINFSDALSGDETLKVYDLTSLVAKSLEVGE